MRGGAGDSSCVLLCVDAVCSRKDGNPTGSTSKVAVLWEGFLHLYFQATSKCDKAERKLLDFGADFEVLKGVLVQIDFEKVWDCPIPCFTLSL